MADILDILNSITSLEISNEDIDRKTSAEKIAFMKKLKKQMEKSKILTERSSEPAHALVRGVYGLLFQKQDTFPESYYDTLADALANAKSYAIYVKPYEQHIGAKLDALRDVAYNISTTEMQKRMSSTMKSGIGPLRKAAIAILIGLGVIYSVITEPDKTDYQSKDKTEQVSPEHEGEYTFYMIQFVPKPGVTIYQDEFGKLAGSKKMTIDLFKGGQEEMTWEFFMYKDDRPNVVIMRRSNGALFTIGLDYHSKRYDELLERIKSRTELFDPNTKMIVTKIKL